MNRNRLVLLRNYLVLHRKILQLQLLLLLQLTILLQGHGELRIHSNEEQRQRVREKNPSSQRDGVRKRGLERCKFQREERQGWHCEDRVESVFARIKV